MGVTPFVVVFFVLGVATLALAIYRWLISKNEEDVVHLAAGEERGITEQVVLARQLNAVDRWGKLLTVLTVLVGLGLAGTYLMKAWQDPSSVPNTFYRR